MVTISALVTQRPNVSTVTSALRRAVCKGRTTRPGVGRDYVLGGGGNNMMVLVLIKPVCTVCTYEVDVVLSQGQSWHCSGSPEGLLLK